MKLMVKLLPLTLAEGAKAVVVAEKAKNAAADFIMVTL